MGLCGHAWGLRNLTLRTWSVYHLLGRTHMALSDCSSRYTLSHHLFNQPIEASTKMAESTMNLSAKNTHGCWQQDTCRVVSMLQGGPKEFSPLMCWDCVAYRRFARSTAQSGSEVQASLGFRQCHGVPVACRLEGLLSPYVDWDEDRTLRCGRTKLDRMEPAGAVGDAQERVYITELVFTSSVSTAASGLHIWQRGWCCLTDG